MINLWSGVGKIFCKVENSYGRRRKYMVKKIVLIGAGGFGREVAQMIEEINCYGVKYELLGFLDDGEGYDNSSNISGYPWLGKSEWILKHKREVVCNCTIAEAGTKAKIQKKLMARGVKFETIRAVTAGVCKDTEIGPGCVLYWNSGVSVNCRLGAGVLLNEGVKVGHDTTIGDFTSILQGSAISGGCRIGEEVNIGGHVFVIPERKIGNKARIAAGSIVFSNVKGGVTVLGNPAKRMKALE